MGQDGKLHVKTLKEAEKYLKNLKPPKDDNSPLGGFVGNDLDRIQRLEKRIETLERLVRGYQQIGIKYADEIEKLKRG